MLHKKEIPAMLKKILIVDDQKSITETIKMIIELQNFVGVIANDGEEALKLVDSEKPDLILLDLMMPNVDGYQVLSVLKKNKDTKGIPVIVVSALIQKENIEKAYKLGANDYLCKSFNPEDLMEKIRINL